MLSTIITKPVKLSVSSKHTGTDEFLRAMVDACVSNVAVLDESGKILYASQAWRQFNQLYTECSRRFTESELDRNADITLSDDIQQILLGKEKEFHRKYYDSSLDRSPFVMHAARLSLPGSTFRILMTYEQAPSVRDDLGQKRLLEMLGTTKILAWKGDREAQRFSYVSDEAIKILGYPSDFWYQPDFMASHIHTDDQRWVLAALQKQTRVAQHFDLTYRMIARDRKVVWIQNLVSVTNENGRPGTRGFMIDISDRKLAEEGLKDFGGRLIAAQEEERRRVARELHDDFNQRLAVLSIELEQLGQKIEKPVSLRKSVQRLQTQAKEISAEIHRLSYRLHPAKLDHLGLAAAVKSLCSEIVDSKQMNVEFRQTGFPATLPKDVTLCVFRIAQEGLRNCVKHSRAELVRVVLTKTKRAVRLTVSDNGCGFETRSEVTEKGLGFISMKERLHILGGEIDVYSKPTRGTRIEVMVPIIEEFPLSNETEDPN
jgi:PAS domain S-box-containing protein